MTKKRRVLQVVLLAVLVPLAAFPAGQSAQALADRKQPYIETGTLLTSSDSQAEIQIVDGPGKTPRTMRFVINESTKRGQVTAGQIVTVTYIKDGARLVAIALNATGVTAPAGAATPYGIAVEKEQSDPMAPHTPGIYMVVATNDDNRKMVQVGRREMPLVAGPGAIAIEMPNREAEITIAGAPAPATARSEEERPELIMYIPPTIDPYLAGKPIDFTLLFLARLTNNTQTRKFLKFKAREIRPGAYELTPDSRLEPGEYAFIDIGGILGHTKMVYDFGIDPK